MIPLDEILDRIFYCPSGCWLWTGADSGGWNRRGGGYPKFWWWDKDRGGPQAVYVHRLMYQYVHGPIPEGYDVDHACRHYKTSWLPFAHRRCINPDHLEAVPKIENQRRKYRGR